MTQKLITNAAFDAAQAPELSVIVPTHNRPEALRGLLGSIAAQDLEARRFEVLVIDNASRPEDARAAEKLAMDQQWRYPMAFCLRKEGGPAAARNRMVEKARGDIVLFLNDDVTLNEAHFSTHLRLHHEHGDPRVAVRGATRWSPDTRDSAVMRYLRARLFVYDRELPPGEENFVYFHTCDLSLKKQFLEQYRFDEDFPSAAFEDTELGYRLYKEADMRLIVTPEALSHHHHDYTARDLIRRARTNGRSAAILIEKQPDLTHRIRDQFYRISRRRRMLAALGRLVTLRMTRFWEQVELITYLRALEREEKRRASRPWQWDRDTRTR